MAHKEMFIKESTIKSMCDAVREKSGVAGPLRIPEQINEAVLGIQEDTKDVVVYQPNDINFYDYKGNLVYSCTIEQAKTMEYPTPPEYDGLTFDCWNHDLEYIRTAERPLDIGGLYYPTDQKLHIWFAASSAFPDIYMAFRLDADAYVDWGDHTVVDVIKKRYSMSYNAYSPKHHYEKPGVYEIVISFDGKFAVAYPSCIYVDTTDETGGKDEVNYEVAKRVTKIWVPKEHWDPDFEFDVFHEPHQNNFFRFMMIDEIVFPNGIQHWKEPYCDYYLKINIIPPSVVDLPELYDFPLKQDMILSLNPHVVHVGNLNEFGANNEFMLHKISLPDSISQYSQFPKITYPDYSDEYPLREIVLPKNFQLKESMFSDQINLEKVFLPKSITEIPDYCFSDCRSLDFKIPSHITKIGIGAFSRTACKNIYVPNTVKFLGSGAFQGCDKLCKIEFAENHTLIEGSVGGERLHTVIVNGKNVVLNCYFHSYVSMTIIGDVIKLGNEVFSDSYVKEVHLPDSVLEIGKSCFQHCGLGSVRLPDKIEILPDLSFANNAHMREFYMPKNIKRIAANAFADSFDEHLDQWNCTFIDFSKSTSVPILDGYEQFTKSWGYYTLEFRVPKSLLEEWKAAPNWSNLADNIVEATMEESV